VGRSINCPRIEGCDYPFTTNAAAPISGFSAFKLKLDIACGATSWTQSRTVVSGERQMTQRP
jgi:hypothetical protein